MSVIVDNMADIITAFPNWMGYTNSLCEYLNNQSYMINSPQYYNLLQKYTDRDIVEKLLNTNYDVQKGFELYVNTCINGVRYIDQYYNTAKQVINLFIQRGAQLNKPILERIFKHQLSQQDFESEVNYIKTKGMILKIFTLQCNVDISSYIDFSKVTSTNWQQIPVQLDYTTKCNMYLKFCYENAS